jgi:hypothetical protein
LLLTLVVANLALFLGRLCFFAPRLLRLVLILVAATLAPMAPLVLLAFPMDTLLELAAKLIFGL